MEWKFVYKFADCRRGYLVREAEISAWCEAFGVDREQCFIENVSIDMSNYLNRIYDVGSGWIPI